MSRPSTYHSSLSSTQSQSTNQHSALQTRINAKRAELENLKQLRDLSATLAAQMTALEQKLSTLRDGTQAVAHVLANWENVLGVIGMAGAQVGNLVPCEGGDEETESQEVEKLPETLVRIPVEDIKAKNQARSGE